MMMKKLKQKLVELLEHFKIDFKERTLLVRFF